MPCVFKLFFLTTVSFTECFALTAYHNIAPSFPCRTVYFEKYCNSVSLPDQRRTSSRQ